MSEPIEVEKCPECGGDKNGAHCFFPFPPNPGGPFPTHETMITAVNSKPQEPTLEPRESGPYKMGKLIDEADCVVGPDGIAIKIWPLDKALNDAYEAGRIAGAKETVGKAKKLIATHSDSEDHFTCGVQEFYNLIAEL